MTTEQAPQDGDVLKQIGDNLRFYADARFKQLTLYVAWITLLAGGLLQYGDKPLAKDLRLLDYLPGVGMLVTAVFWVLETRASLYWRALRDADPRLLPRPPDSLWSWFSSTNAVFFCMPSSFHSGLR